MRVLGTFVSEMSFPSGPDFSKSAPVPCNHAREPQCGTAHYSCAVAQVQAAAAIKVCPCSTAQSLTASDGGLGTRPSQYTFTGAAIGPHHRAIVASHTPRSSTA
jgi:hypothetical protein